jgi:hypothetical protein
VSDPSLDTGDADAVGTSAATTTDHALLATRLAAIERALGARACDCAHEAFEPSAPAPAAPDGRELPSPRTDPHEDLRVAVRALCEYVLASERAAGPAAERTAAVRVALEDLGPARADETPDRDETPDGRAERLGVRAWLERVAAATFE